jgi:hypothetical protein
VKCLLRTVRIERLEEGEQCQVKVKRRIKVVKELDVVKD